MLDRKSCFAFAIVSASVFAGAVNSQQTADVVGTINDATSFDQVRTAIEDIDNPDALEDLLAALSVLDFSDPIIEKIEKTRRQMIIEGTFRPCDVFFPETGPLFPDAADTETYLILTVSELVDAGGMLVTKSELDHDVLTMMAVSGQGLTPAIHTYASQNIHRIEGQLTVMDGKIESVSDQYNRATFLILKDTGLVYMRGVGQVTSSDGQVTDLTDRSCG